jgi:hypothetical protein
MKVMSQKKRNIRFVPTYCSYLSEEFSYVILRLGAPCTKNTIISSSHPKLEKGNKTVRILLNKHLP